MKTIIRNEDNVSLYLFDNETPISIFDNRIEVGMPIFLIIGDCNSDNVTIYDDVNPPSDWLACKYTFDGDVWAQNVDYPPISPTE